jgi:hypothetical protein
LALTQPLCACDCLILNAGIPLRLNDKDAVCHGEVQSCLEMLTLYFVYLQLCCREGMYSPKSTGTSRHDKHRHARIRGKLFEDLPTARECTFAVDSFEGYRMLVKMPPDQIQGSGPAGENYTSTSKK